MVVNVVLGHQRWVRWIESSCRWSHRGGVVWVQAELYGGGGVQTKSQGSLGRSMSVLSFVIRDGFGGLSLPFGGAIGEVWFGSKRSDVGACAEQRPCPWW